MSDDLDKFVLQYQVEMKDAIVRLEQLNQKVEKVAKTQKSASSQVKDFASDATSEIGKLIPGLDKVSAAIRLIGAEFAVAGLAVGALAIGIKSVMDMRNQYNQQRKESMDIGVSSLRLEEYQRKFVKASGGKITREQTAEEIKKLSQFSSAVYRDPTRIGTEARTARVLGIDMGAPGTHKSVNELMVQLGEKFSKMTDAQVQAQAKTLGLNQDFALGLKKQGGSVGQITELTTSEIESRKVAQEQLMSFDAAVARLADNFKKAENILGEKLLPPFIKFVNWMERLSNALPKMAENYDPAKSAQSAIPPQFSLALKAWGLISDKLFPNNGEKKPDESAGRVGQMAAKAATASADGAKANSKATADLKSLVDGEYEANADAKNIADQQALAINQFAGAVASFANAVDEKQAWAAWAGEIGKASGLSAPKMAATTLPAAIGQQKPGPLPAMGSTAYDEIFKAAGEKYKLDPALLKNVARVESGFNPNATSKVGATGLMQVMPDNFKELGIKNPKDPFENIMGGAKLLSQYMAKAGGDVAKALTFYHGGFDQSKWGPLTRAYPGKVLGEGNVVEGESRSKINVKSVQNTIAQRLGVPVAQLQQGGVNRGDVSFASSQIQSGIQNQIYDIKNQLKAVNLPQQTMSKLMTELRAQQTGLSLMRQYGEQVVDKAQPGGRSITIGERAVIINVNGAIDPAETAEHVRSQLGEHLGEIVNGTSTGMKR